MRKMSLTKSSRDSVSESRVKPSVSRETFESNGMCLLGSTWIRLAIISPPLHREINFRLRRFGRRFEQAAGRRINRTTL